MGDGEIHPPIFYTHPSYGMMKLTASMSCGTLWVRHACLERRKTAMTDARRRATAKYKKLHIYHFVANLSKKANPDVIEYLTGLPDRKAWLVSCVREEMAKEQGGNEK